MMLERFLNSTKPNWRMKNERMMSYFEFMCALLVSGSVITTIVALIVIRKGTTKTNLQSYREQYEEVKVRNALHTLKEYCDNHVDCKGCYIASRKSPYEACPCATLVNEVNVDDK